MGQTLVSPIIFRRCLIWLLFNTENQKYCMRHWDLFFSHTNPDHYVLLFRKGNQRNQQTQWRNKEAGGRIPEKERVRQIWKVRLGVEQWHFRHWVDVEFCRKSSGTLSLQIPYTRCSLILSWPKSSFSFFHKTKDTFFIFTNNFIRLDILSSAISHTI